MEDITTYGEISGGSHKGETTSTSVFMGIAFMMAALFFVLNGLYHIGVSLTPYWERVTVGPMAETKGTGNFLAFTLLAFCRPIFGIFLGWLALEIWDGRSTARRWIYLVVLPLVLYLFNAFGDMAPSMSEKLWTYRFLATNLGATAFLASLFLLTVVMAIIPFVGWMFRETSRDQSWVMTIVYIIVVAVVLGGASAQLEPIEFDTAMMANLPPFSHEGSGLEFLILESITPEYLECMENLRKIDKACQLRAKVQKIQYDNFDSKLRTERLFEILQKHGCLAEHPICGDGGYYVADIDGNWSCSVHGSYDADKVQRGKDAQALLGGDAQDANYGDGLDGGE